MSDTSPIPTNPVVLDVLSPSATGSTEPPPSSPEAAVLPSSDSEIEEGSLLADLAQAMADSDGHNLFDLTPTEKKEEEKEEEVVEVEPEVAEAIVESETSTPPTSTTPPTSPPTALDLNKIAERFYGRPLDENQAVAFLQFSSDVERLARTDPQRFNQIQQLLSGQNLPPALAPTTPLSPQYQTPPSPVPPSPTSPTPEYVDPDVAAALTPIVQSQQQLQAQFEQLQSYNQQQEYNRIQLENQNRAEQVNKAESEWRAQRDSITPEEYVSFSANLQSTLRSAPGLFPSFLQANNGDTTKATHALLDHFYWNDPTFREREIHNQVVRERASQVEQRKKTSKSSALTGGGGGKASTQDPPPQDRGARVAAMADEIAEIFKQ